MAQGLFRPEAHWSESPLPNFVLLITSVLFLLISFSFFLPLFHSSSYYSYSLLYLFFLFLLNSPTLSFFHSPPSPLALIFSIVLVFIFIPLRALTPSLSHYYSLSLFTFKFFLSIFISSLFLFFLPSSFICFCLVLLPPSFPRTSIINPTSPYIIYRPTTL